MSESTPARASSERIVEAVLADVRKGRMLILVDDEDRENEGDLFVAAERATPEAINFMATEARGLVSLALPDERMRALGLELIIDDTGNTTRFGTAFATPIDARQGVSSGMSAHDRVNLECDMVGKYVVRAAELAGLSFAPVGANEVRH